MDELVRFPCPNCGRHLKVSRGKAGMRGRCSCGQTVLVPSSEQVSPTEEASRPPWLSQRRSSTASDRNLLFGILALQMDFVTRDQLVEGMQAWVLNKSQPLEKILVSTGLLSKTDCDLILPLLDRHIAQHQGNPELSLKSLSSITPSVDILRQINDNELNRSLDGLRLRDPITGDLPATVSFVLPEQPSLRYQMLRPHAKGGLGEVFVARDMELGREVALKEIQHQYAHEQSSRTRFLVEAEITGKLEHPGIVPVYGLGTYPDGRPFYAMRFIKGDSLHDAIRQFHKIQGMLRGSNPFESVAFRRLLRRFVDVCNAVGYAHSRGVLHRDLKPGNIMLGKHGETLVVDWGLAKLKGRPASTTLDEATLQISASGSNSDQTLPGSAIGTPGYMSPEQAEGRLDLLGPATDIYSLGATLYSLLTGRKPIEASNAMEMLRLTVRGEIKPPREICPQIPRPLEAICCKALSISLAARYPTCEALAEEIERWLAGETVAAYPEPFNDRVKRWIRKHRTLTTSVVLVLLVAVIGLLVGNTLLKKAHDREAEARQELQREKETIEQQNKIVERQNKIVEQQKQEVEQQKQEVEQSAAKATESSALATKRADELELKNYYNTIRLAHRDWLDNDIDSALVRLESCPAKLRGWEWYYCKRLCHSEVLTLSGDWRCAPAFSPKGNLIAAAKGPFVILHNAQTGDEVRRLVGLLGSIHQLAFSSEGDRLVAISGVSVPATDRDKRVLAEEGVIFLNDKIDIDKGEAIIWDVNTGDELSRIRTDTGRLFCVDFSRDGSSIAIGSMDNIIQIRNTTTGVIQKAWRAYDRGQQNLRAVLFSHDGKQIISVADRGPIKVWGTARANLLKTLDYTDATNISRSPDGKMYATPHKDRNIRLWRSDTFELMDTLGRHHDTVLDVDFSADGKHLVSSSRDQTVQLWDIETGLSLKTFRGHRQSVHSVCFSPDGSRIVAGGGDNRILAWDVKSDHYETPLLPSHTYMISLEFSHDGAFLATENTLFDTSTGKQRMPLDAHVVFDAVGRHVAVKTRNKQSGKMEVQVWKADFSEAVSTIRTFTESFGEFSKIALSPDGTMLAKTDFDAKNVQLWNVNTGENVATWPVYPAFLTFHPNGNWISFVIEDGQKKAVVQLWDVEMGRELKTFAGPGDLLQVVFNKEGTKLASGGHDGVVRIWDVSTGKDIQTLKGHTQRVTDISFHPSENRIATSSYDKTIRIWDIATGEELLTFRDTKWVNCLAFSPNGQELVSGGNENVVKVYKAISMEQMKALKPAEDFGKLSDARSLVSRMLNDPDAFGYISNDYKADAAVAIANRGIEYLRNNKYDIAIADLTRALDILPEHADITAYRGASYLQNNQLDLAQNDLSRAIMLGTTLKWAYFLRGEVFRLTHKYDMAIADYSKAIQNDSADKYALKARADMYFLTGQYDLVISDCNAAIGLDDQDFFTYDLRARTSEELGKYNQAILDWTASIQLKSENVDTQNAIAWLLATCPEKSIRDGKRALEHASKACELTEWKSSAYFDTLAAAYAESGQFDDAIKWQKKAMSDSKLSPKVLEDYKVRLKLYESRTPYRMPSKQ